MNYLTAFGDKIPNRDNLDDGCEFDYFDIGAEVKKQTAIWKMTTGMQSFQKSDDERGAE